MECKRCAELEETLNRAMDHIGKSGLTKTYLKQIVKYWDNKTIAMLTEALEYSEQCFEIIPGCSSGSAIKGHAKRGYNKVKTALKQVDGESNV